MVNVLILRRCVKPPFCEVGDSATEEDIDLDARCALGERPNSATFFASAFRDWGRRLCESASVPLWKIVHDLQSFSHRDGEEPKWINKFCRTAAPVSIGIDAAAQSNGIALRIPSDGRIVISEVVVLAT